MAMSDKEKQKAAELEKAQKPDEEEEEMEEKEEGEEEEKSEKSEDLSEDDLEKSLAKLEGYVEGKDEKTRKEILLEKAQKSSLSKSEQDELFQILGGSEATPSSPLIEDVSKAMEPSEDMQKALDVSDFLSETHEETKRVTTVLAEHMQKSDARQQDFNLLLAKAVADIGKLSKSIDERLAGIEGQPARPPKSKIKPLEKSFANSDAPEVKLSKGEILDTMNTMFRKSFDAGEHGLVNGVDMEKACAKYEITNQLDRNVLQMVMKERGALH
jgi:hypothetical protein